jgi:hypothetical protein
MRVLLHKSLTVKYLTKVYSTRLGRGNAYYLLALPISMSMVDIANSFDKYISYHITIIRYN